MGFVMDTSKETVVVTDPRTDEEHEFSGENIDAAMAAAQEWADAQDADADADA